MHVLLLMALLGAEDSGPFFDKTGGGGGGVGSGGVVESGSLHLEDDIPLSGGNTLAAPDFKLLWDTSGTHQLQIWLTDCDGGGTDCAPLYWLTGTSTAVFNGDIDLNTNSKKLLADEGAVGAPSITLGDATTGFYRSAANQIAVTVAGTNAVKFTNPIKLYYPLNSNNQRVYNVAAALNLGGSYATTESLATGAVVIGKDAASKSLEVEGSSYFKGEVEAAGVSGDGAGKAVCIKADGNLGTCTDAVGVGGTCTCT